MPSSMPRRIAITGALVVLALALLAMPGLLSYTGARSLAHVLEQSGSSEAVIVHGIEYQVDRGTISPLPPAADTLLIESLAYSKFLARSAPLLALPGIDSREFLEAVDGLEMLQREIASRQSDASSAAAVQSGLFPIRFLRAATALEAARQTFLHEATEEHARTYELALNAALDAYLFDLAHFEAAFRTVVPPQVSAYTLQAHVVTRSDVLSALALARSQVRSMEKEVGQRSQCARGVAHACIRRPSAYSESVDVSAPVSIAAAAHIRSMYKEAGFKAADAPFVVLSSSTCLRTGTPLVFSLYTPEYRGEDLPFQFPLFVGDISFIKSTAYPKDSFFSYFARAGARYVLKIPLSHYACPSVYSDVGTINAILSVRDFAAREHLSQYSSNPRLRILETSLGSAAVRENDAREYLTLAEGIARADHVRATTSGAIAELSLQLRTKSLGLLPVIQKIRYFDTVNLAASDRGLIAYDLRPQHLFFVRSGFASLFVLQSIFDDSAPMLFGRNDLPESSQPYADLATLEQEVGTRSLVHDMSVFYELYSR